MRWTQLNPMLMVCCVGLVILLALSFVNFQEQTFSVLETIMQWLMQLPIVGDRIAQQLADEGSEIHVNTGDFKSFVLRAWSITPLGFMLASMSLSALFGPFKPWTLKRKLLLAGFGVMLILAGLVFNYYANTQNFNGGASGWMLNFSLISLAVFLVSTYCLSVSHILLYLSDTILTDDTVENANTKYDLD